MRQSLAKVDCRAHRAFEKHLRLTEHRDSAKGRQRADQRQPQRQRKRRLCHLSAAAADFQKTGQQRAHGILGDGPEQHPLQRADDPHRVKYCGK